MQTKLESRKWWTCPAWPISFGFGVLDSAEQQELKGSTTSVVRKVWNTWKLLFTLTLPKYISTFHSAGEILSQILNHLNFMYKFSYLYDESQ